MIKTLRALSKYRFCLPGCLGAVLLFLLAFFPLAVSSQLVVNTAPTATQLAQSLVGPGVSISNIQMNCPTLAKGSFDATNANVGIGNGVLLTSGWANEAIGPNDDGGAGMDNFAAGDADLATLISGVQTYDACVLEFDVVPLSDTLKFNYVFASEEYPEFVNSSFNDVFGFFISGPGIAGTQNIALLPGTTTPVSIDNVNATTNNSYYVNNGDGTTFPYNSSGNYVQYDGLTTVLEARAIVTPCQTYHLKLAIADAGDGGWDSGVFLEAGSLSSSGVNVSAATSAGSSFSNAMEGCVDGIVTFTRTPITPLPKTIYYSVGGSAINGVDYAFIPDSVIIPANQSSADVHIVPVQDGVTEGNETVKLYIFSSCAGVPVDSAVVQIMDELEVQALPGDTIICDGSSVMLDTDANFSGGLSYNWTPAISLSNGSIANPSASPSATTTYVVTANNSFGCAGSDSMTIVVAPAINTTFSYPSTDYCISAPDPAPVSIATMGGNFSATGGLNIDANSGQVDISSGTPGNSYTVTYQVNLGCTASANFNINILPNDDATFGYPSNSYCAGTAPVSPTNIATPGGIFSTNGLTIDSASGLVSFDNAAADSTYLITYTTAGVCSDSSFFAITINPLPPVGLTGVNTVYCEDEAPITMGGTPAGGSFSGYGVSGNVFSPGLLGAGGPYNVTYTYTDANGCTDSSTLPVTVVPLPSVSFTGLDSGYCQGDSTAILSGFPAGGTYTGTGVSGNVFDPGFAVSGNYSSVSYTYTDSYGCSNTATQQTQVYESPAVIFSGLDSQYCVVGNTSLLSGIPAGGTFSGTGISGNLFNPAIAGVGGPFYISYQYTNMYGCSGEYSQETWVFDVQPVMITGLDSAYCESETVVTLSGSPTGGIFNGPGVTGNSFSPQAVGSGGPYDITYTVNAATGCVSTATAQITVFPLPELDFVIDPFYCLESPSVTVLGSPSGGTLSGSGVVGNSFVPSTVGPGGPYDITYSYTDSNGCYNEETYQTTVVAHVVDAGSDQTIVIGQTATLSANGGISYLWTPTATLDCVDCTTVEAAPTETTAYTVMSTDINGCIDEDEVVVFVEANPNVFIPNAFTPNGDMLNDNFFAYGPHIDKIKNLRVYSRWGEMLFNGTNLAGQDESSGWDGTYQGKELPPGVFAYVMEIKLLDGKLITETGNVTLIR